MALTISLISEHKPLDVRFPCPIKVTGKAPFFFSVYHAYIWHKSPNKHYRAFIANLNQAHVMQFYGEEPGYRILTNQLRIFESSPIVQDPHWDVKGPKLLRMLTEQKFTHQLFKQALLETQKKTLVFDIKDTDFADNRYGKLLMRLRKRLREEHHHD